jgi:hypothetical protein
MVIYYHLIVSSMPLPAYTTTLFAVRKVNTGDESNFTSSPAHNTYLLCHKNVFYSANLKFMCQPTCSYFSRTSDYQQENVKKVCKHLSVTSQYLVTITIELSFLNTLSVKKAHIDLKQAFSTSIVYDTWYYP